MVQVKTYEYQVETFIISLLPKDKDDDGSEDMCHDLKWLGNRGWELVSANAILQDDDTVSRIQHVMYFKREKGERKIRPPRPPKGAIEEIGRGSIQ